MSAFSQHLDLVAFQFDLLAFTMVARQPLVGARIVQLNQNERNRMLSWSLTFLIFALIAAVLGFAGIAGIAATIGKVLFVIFLVLFLVSLIAGRPRGV